MKIALRCRVPCERYEVVNRSRRFLGYDRSSSYTSRPAIIEFEIPDGALDPAAAVILPRLGEPGLQIFGEAADGRRGEHYVPIYYVDRSPPLARWINQIVEDYRAGRPCLGIPPLVKIRLRWWAFSGQTHVDIDL